MRRAARDRAPQQRAQRGAEVEQHAPWPRGSATSRQRSSASRAAASSRSASLASASTANAWQTANGMNGASSARRKASSSRRAASGSPSASSNRARASDSVRHAARRPARPARLGCGPAHPAPARRRPPTGWRGRRRGGAASRAASGSRPSASSASRGRPPSSSSSRPHQRDPRLQQPVRRARRGGARPIHEVPAPARSPVQNRIAREREVRLGRRGGRRPAAPLGELDGHHRARLRALHATLAQRHRGAAGLGQQQDVFVPALGGQAGALPQVLAGRLDVVGDELGHAQAGERQSTQLGPHDLGPGLRERTRAAFSAASTSPRSRAR